MQSTKMCEPQAGIHRFNVINCPTAEATPTPVPSNLKCCGDFDAGVAWVRAEVLTSGGAYVQGGQLGTQRNSDNSGSFTALFMGLPYTAPNDYNLLLVVFGYQSGQPETQSVRIVVGEYDQPCNCPSIA